MKSCGKNRFILLILFVFLLKAILYAAYIIPLDMGKTPDDVGHISYVAYMASEHKIPQLNEVKIERSLGKNFVDGEKGLKINTEQYEEYIADTDEYEDYTKTNWIAQHPPLYYLYLLPAYLLTTHFTSDITAVNAALRLATALLGVVTLYFLYRAMKLLGLGNIAVSCVMVCAAFSHAIQFYLTAVDNDAMVICLSTTAFYFFAKYLKEDRQRDIFIFAALCGGITITKYTGAVVLPVYAAVYLWEELFVKKKGFSSVVRRSLVCVLIFAVITGPVLIQNVSRYGILFPTSGDDERLYEGSFAMFKKFVFENRYFEEIISHIVNLTGWFYWLNANGTEMYLVSLIVLTACFSYLRGSAVLWLLPLLAGEALARIFHMERSTAIMAAAVLCMMVMAVAGTGEARTSLDRGMCVLTVVMMAFFGVVFMAEHYNIFLQRGTTGAMHGRYYYPLIAPFFFLLFRRLEDGKDKLEWLLPVVMLFINVGMEAELVLRGIGTW